MPRIQKPLALTLLIVTATAQSTVVIPAAAAAAPGSTSNAFPWGSGASSWPGLRLMCVYDAQNFVSQSINHPITITRLRWRPDNGAAGYAGGTFAQATVALSTAAVDWTTVTTNFGSNHGGGYALCYSGPVTHPASGGGPFGTPAPWAVDVQLTTPFLYDPNLGDLVIDVDYPGLGNYAGGSLPQMDVHGTGAMSSRVFASSMYPAANGTTIDHGVCVEVTWLPPGPNVAQAVPYGEGCYDRFASLYESFPPAAFDLANQGFGLVPAGDGYLATAGTTGWFTPVSQPLGIGDDTVVGPFPLGFTLDYPGGSTQSLWISSNGFVWPQSNTSHGCCQGSASQLLSDAARWCAMWTDLNPLSAGQVLFDVDPANNAAYVTFLGVPEFSSLNLSTFQLAFHAHGAVEFRYQNCAILNHTTVTGWSPGGGARDPGGLDLSTALPHLTAPDFVPLRLGAGSRPIINTTVTLTVREVPLAAPLGVFVGGVAPMVPGINLAGLGMPGCFQYSSHEAVLPFFPNGGAGSFALTVPNDPGLSGTSIYLQAAVISPLVNALGAVSSNGVDMRVGTQ